MPISADDQTMHAIPNTVELPGSSRSTGSASLVGQSRWSSAKATPIPRPDQHNPFTASRTKDTLSGSRAQRDHNHARRQTLVPPLSNKRLKTNEAGAYQPGQTSRYSGTRRAREVQAQTAPERLPVEQNEVIDLVDDPGEDFGVPVDTRSRHFANGVLPKDGANTERLQQNVHGLATTQKNASAATSGQKMEVEVHDVPDSEDEIQPFSSDTPYHPQETRKIKHVDLASLAKKQRRVSPRPPKGGVRDKVRHIERSHANNSVFTPSSMPNMYFAKPIPRKVAMKPKNPEPTPRSTFPADAASAPTLSPPGKNPSGCPPQKVGLSKGLPLEAWTIGHRLFNTPSYLTWESEANNLKLMIFTQDGSHTESLISNREIESMSMTDPEEPGYKYAPVLRLDSAQTSDLGSSLGDDFESGTRKGALTLRFQRAGDWSTSKYRKFIRLLVANSQGKKETLRGQGATDAVWQVATEIVRMKEAARAREEATRQSTKRPAPSSSEPEEASTSRTRAKAQEASPTSSPGVEITEAIAPRRSTRRAAAATAKPPPPEPDELILVYPPATTGAVNISTSDVARLDPGEFLNDNLIEFGLKLWHKELEASNPELAEQIHVFSSFFYKKLNKKNIEDGYDSVRRWTSKFDIFKKKFIVIPINENLHWYLAIICHPEHVLLPPAEVKSPSTRGKTRKSLASVEQAKDPDATRPCTPEPLPMDVDALAKVEPSSEAGDVDFVNSQLLDFESSCAISPGKDNHMMEDAPLEDSRMPVDTPSSPLTSVPPSPNKASELLGSDSSDDDELRLRSPSKNVFDPQRPPSPRRHQYPPSPTASQTAAVNTARGSAAPTLKSDDEVDQLADDPQLAHKANQVGVSVASFYGPQSASSDALAAAHFPSLRPPTKAKADTAVNSMDVDDDDFEASRQPATYVFTLDSLGTQHRKVVTNLTKYLHLEAKERKQVTKPSSARGKSASVPAQPNYCDCGIYLLHFAQTFFTDPDRYKQQILTRTRTTPSAKERSEQWQGELLGDARERLKARITELSIEWKKERAEKEAQKKDAPEDTLGESGDSDIDIVETTPPADKTPKGPATYSKKGKGKEGTGSTRLRG